MGWQIVAIWMFYFYWRHLLIFHVGENPAALMGIEFNNDFILTMDVTYSMVIDCWNFIKTGQNIWGRWKCLNNNYAA